MSLIVDPGFVHCSVGDHEPVLLPHGDGVHPTADLTSSPDPNPTPKLMIM